VGHVVESLPLQGVLIPLADQPKLNVPLRVLRLKKVLNPLGGKNLKKEKNNGKEKEKIYKENVMWLWG